MRNQFFDWLSGRFFYGWAIVAVAMLVMFASGPGQSHTFSVFLGPVSTELGLSQTQWGVGYGFATLLAAFGLPYMGRLTDRFGPRRMLLGIAAALGAACIAYAGVIGPVTLGLSFAALRFLAQGSLMLNASNVISRWFSRRRGFALSLMALGFSASMAIHPPLAQWLIDTQGWRQAWLWMGFSTWVLLLPVVYLVLRDRPGEVGLRPDGDDANDAVADAASQSANLSGLTRAEALRTRAFYIICVGLFTLSMLVTALHMFQVSIFESHGLDPAIAARVFPISALTMVIAIPIVGRLLDRFPTRWIFAGAQVVMASSLIAVTQVDGLVSAIVYGIVFGLNNSVTMTLFAFVWPRFFGLRHLGSIQGVGQTIGVVGASLGALPLGIAFDLFGSYDTTLMVLAVQPIICAVLAVFLQPPKILQPAAAEEVGDSSH